MLGNTRQFEVTDPFRRKWTAEFRWQQNAISIRHADAVDCKYYVSNGKEKREVIISLPHPGLVAAARKLGRDVTDSWCMRLATLHLEHMIATWEDMERTIVTLSERELALWSGRIEDGEREAREKAAVAR